MSFRSLTFSGSLSSSKVNLVGMRVTTTSVRASTPWRSGGLERASPPQKTIQ